MQKLDEKVYLGDAVYAEFDGYSICLTTENGITTTNIVVLEPEVFKALLNYNDNLKAFVKKMLEAKG